MTPAHFFDTLELSLDAVELTGFERKFNHVLREIQRSICPAMAKPTHTMASHVESWEEMVLQGRCGGSCL